MKFDSLDSNFACARFHQVPSNRILTKLTLRFHLCSLSVHCEFSRIVCVSLFSYQGCLSVISLRQPFYFIISFKSCQALFSKVFKIFRILSKVVCFCRSVQATWLLYHKFSHLSTVNSNFLKTILFFSISEAIPCDSLFTIPLPQGIVKHFFTNSPYFFITLFSRSFFFNH